MNAESPGFLPVENEISPALDAFEHAVMDGMSGESGRFEGKVSEELMTEILSRISESFLEEHAGKVPGLKYKRPVVNASIQNGKLYIASKTDIISPHKFNVAIGYTLENGLGDAGSQDENQLASLSLVPNSLDIRIHAGFVVKGLAKGLFKLYKIEEKAKEMLQDPAERVKDTFHWRFKTARNFDMEIGKLGLKINENDIGVVVIRKNN